MVISLDKPRRALLGFGALAALALASSAAPAAPHSFHYLAAEEFTPTLVLPAPPAPNSAQANAELAAVRMMVQNASPRRLELARWDDIHETPALFDQTLGIELEKLPLTWALLRDVQEEAEAAVGPSKAFFHRTRPYAIDLTLATCVNTAKGNPATSYPSGHAILGFSTGFVLAQLIKGRAPAILDRAADYAASREYCGVHFPSDIDASHALGLLVASKLMAVPGFRAKFDAAHAELVAAHVTGA